MEKINSSAISVVVQGLVYKDTTAKCLKSIREILPGAQIILSTWKNMDLTDLDYDILQENDDPGATRMFVNDEVMKYNFNREIVSTQNGLKHANRKYCMKFRTDFVLLSDKFLDYLYKYPYRCDNWKVTKERIIFPIATLPYHRVFHPGDVMCFGLTEDVTNMWSIPLPNPEYCDWFLNHDLPELFLHKFHGALSMKIGAEPYLWSEFLKKYQSQFGEIDFQHNWDGSKKNIELSKLTIANNIIVLDRDQLEFDTPEHKYLFTPAAKDSWLPHKLWELYYNEFCLPKSKKSALKSIKYHILCFIHFIKETNYVPYLKKMIFSRKIFKKNIPKIKEFITLYNR